MKNVNESLTTLLSNAALLGSIAKGLKPSFWTTVLLMLKANKPKARVANPRAAKLKTRVLNALAKKGFNKRLFKESVQEKKIPPIVAKWARDMNVPVKEVLKRFEKAAQIASKKFPPETKEWWAYKIGIFKQMMYKNPGQNKGGRGVKAIKKAASAT